MKTIRFYFTILGAVAILLFAGCGSDTMSDGNPAGQSITDSSDNHESPDRNERPERHPRSADTVDVKPMP